MDLRGLELKCELVQPRKVMSHWYSYGDGQIVASLGGSSSIEAFVLPCNPNTVMQNAF